MDVIAHEAQEVDGKECPREPREPLILFLEEQIQGECHGDRYPAEVEHASHEVGYGAVMHREIFAGDHHRSVVGYGAQLFLRRRRDSEQRLLCPVESCDIDVVDEVVGIEAHGVVCHSKDKPRQEIDGKAPRCLPKIKEDKQCYKI